MDDTANVSSYLSLLTEGLSDHSVVETVSGPSSNAGPFLSQGSFLEHEDNRWPLDIPLNTHSLSAQIKEEAYSAYPAATGLHPPIQTTLVRASVIDERVGKPAPYHGDLVNFIHEVDLPVIRPWCSMHWTTAPPEVEFTPIDLARLKTACDFHQDGMSTSTDVPSIQSPRYTHTDTMADFSVPSIFPMIPIPPTIGHSQGQRSSQDRQQETGRRPVIVSPQSSRRLAGIRRDHTGRYSCDECGKSYSQPSGTRRHQRETHDACFCLICRNFEWGRPYLLREHLEKEHPEVDIDAALDDAVRARRKVTGFATHPRG